MHAAPYADLPAPDIFHHAIQAQLGLPSQLRAGLRDIGPAVGGITWAPRTNAERHGTAIGMLKRTNQSQHRGGLARANIEARQAGMPP